MLNEEQLAKLRDNVSAWNEWRKADPAVTVDLRGANLSGASLIGANLAEADLTGADLSSANLFRADLWLADLQEANLQRAYLREADIHGADLKWADLAWADLRGANLTLADLADANLFNADLSAANLHVAYFFQANLHGVDFSYSNLIRASFFQANLSEAVLSGANLSQAYLKGANLSEAYLTGASLNEATLTEANLTQARLSGADLSVADLSYSPLGSATLDNAKLNNCRVFGVSAWKVNLEHAEQKQLVITPEEEPDVTVDNLEVAQFVYLLLNNAKIRDVIDTVGKKAVLILGRFTEERKAVLDAIRDELRRRDYLPILFDFKKPSNRNLTETITTLAHMARFIIADITEAKSIPQELYAIVPHLPSVPVQAIIERSQSEYAMFESFRPYPWVLPVYRYDSTQHLLASLGEHVVAPAESKLSQPV